MPWANDPESRARSAKTYGDPEYKRNRATCLRQAGCALPSTIGRCAGCKRIRRLQCDHIIPVANGGTHALSNLQALCTGPGGCHGRKTGDQHGWRARGQPATDPEPEPRTVW